MKTWLRTTAAALCAALLATLAPHTAQADDFPAKTIVLVSQASAGSSMDLFCREIAKLAPKYLHQTMIVESKVGADGAVAMEYVLSQPADGYTMAAITRSFATTLDSDLKDKYKPDQFSFIASLVADSYVLSVSSDSPYKTIRDFLNSAKTTPLTVAGFGTDSAEGLFLKQLANESKAKLNWVPYGGGAAAIAPVLGGHIVAALNHPGDVKSFVDGGKLRVLAASNDSALAIFPNAVTFRSIGYRDLTVLHYRGIIGKAGMPPATERKLDDFFNAVSRDPEVIAYMKSVLVEPYFRGSRDFTNMVHSDLDSLGRQITTH
jgi:tripartite-type tricarboxylate transporter receptor subunit TctC